MIAWLLSKLFPPKLPNVGGHVVFLGPAEEDLGDGIVACATPRPYRDAIDRHWQEEDEKKVYAEYGIEPPEHLR